MLISVVVPVYNSQKYLKECVSSILSQKKRDIELLLIDDGSSDESAAMCDEFALQGSRVIVIHNKNGGASRARNIGINLASGDYIHFVDSDDFVNNPDVYGRLEKSALLCYPDIIFSRRTRYSEDLLIIEAIQPQYTRQGYFNDNILLDVLKNQYQLTLTCPVNKMFRRAFLQENPLLFVRGLSHEEDEWLPRVIASAKSVWYDEGVLYSVRSRPGSLSETKDDFTRAKKAWSKAFIAVHGMEYMKAKNLDRETMQLTAAHYWGYMLDACVSTQIISDRKLRGEVLSFIRENRDFFRYYQLLANRNWRLMGWLFLHIGILPMVKIVAKRYGIDKRKKQTGFRERQIPDKSAPAYRHPGYPYAVSGIAIEDVAGIEEVSVLYEITCVNEDCDLVIRGQGRIIRRMHDMVMREGCPDCGNKRFAVYTVNKENTKMRIEDLTLVNKA